MTSWTILRDTKLGLRDRTSLRVHDTNVHLEKKARILRITCDNSNCRFFFVREQNCVLCYYLPPLSTQMEYSNIQLDWVDRSQKQYELIFPYFKAKLRFLCVQETATAQKYPEDIQAILGGRREVVEESDRS